MCDKVWQGEEGGQNWSKIAWHTLWMAPDHQHILRFPKGAHTHTRTHKQRTGNLVISVTGWNTHKICRVQARVVFNYNKLNYYMINSCIPWSTQFKVPTENIIIVTWLHWSMVLDAVFTCFSCTFTLEIKVHLHCLRQSYKPVHFLQNEFRNTTTKLVLRPKERFRNATNSEL